MGGDGSVIDVAVPGAICPSGVMTGRTTQPKSGGFALRQGARRAQGALRRSQRRVKRPGHNWRGKVGHVITGPVEQGFGFVPPTQWRKGGREQGSFFIVGDFLLPFGVGVLQKLDVARVVNRQNVGDRPKSAGGKIWCPPLACSAAKIRSTRCGVSKLAIFLPPSKISKSGACRACRGE